MNIIEILTKITKKIETMESIDPAFLRSRGNDNGFEELFPIVLEEIIYELNLQTKLEYKIHLGHHFPDIDIILNGVKYGIELKYRSNGAWNTNGNSVFESITGTDYEEIYVVFASKIPKKNQLLVRYAPYWEVASNIKVTHSPRFTIDMDNKGQSVFDSKESYTLLRQMNEHEKVSFVQNYLREHNNSAKWYVSPTNNVLPTKFSSLSIKKRKQIQAELCILFPDDLLHGSNSTKYNRTAEYLLDTHYIYNSSLRDIFSSGGIYNYNNVSFPQIIRTFVSLEYEIHQTLISGSKDFFDLCYFHWKKNMPDSLIVDNPLDSYVNILNYLGTLNDYPDRLNRAKITNLSTLILDTSNS